MRRHSVLELSVGGRLLACEADQLRVTRGLTGTKLPTVLGLGDSSGSLCVEISKSTGACFVFSGVDRAIIREVADDQFVRLPKILDELGCPKWVRGVMELGEGLAIWVDLILLSETLGSEARLD